MRKPILHRRRFAALSLVEVTIALGIAAFGLVVLFGLLPTGLNLVRESSDEGLAVNILTSLVADVKLSATEGTPSRYEVNLAPGMGTNYFDEHGISLGATLTSDAIYKATWESRARDVTNGVYPNVHLLVGWPASRPQPGGWVEAVVLLP